MFVCFWLLIWQLAAAWTDNSIILTGPLETLRSFAAVSREPQFLLSVLRTLAGIAAGFFLAVLLALVLGLIAYRSPFFRQLLAPLLTLLKAIPVASFAILAIIWLRGSNRLSSFVSFVVVFPMVFQNTVSGFDAADGKLLEMASLFQLSAFKKLRFIYIPALLPYLRTCFKTALGMAWRSGVAAELIGQPRGTIGSALYQAKIFLDTPAVFAWTIWIILLSRAFEALVMLLLELLERSLHEPGFQRKEESDGGHHHPGAE